MVVKVEGIDVDLDKCQEYKLEGVTLYRITGGPYAGDWVRFYALSHLPWMFLSGKEVDKYYIKESEWL